MKAFSWGFFLGALQIFCLVGVAGFGSVINLESDFFDSGQWVIWIIIVIFMEIYSWARRM